MNRFYHKRSVARRKALKIQRWIRNEFYGFHSTTEQRLYFEWFMLLLGKTCLDCKKCGLDKDAKVVCPRGRHIKSYSTCDAFEEVVE